MNNYRLYFMTRDGAHIEDFTLVKADSDSEAIKIAQTHACTQPIELWWRGRKVQVFAGVPALTAPEPIADVIPSAVGADAGNFRRSRQ